MNRPGSPVLVLIAAALLGLLILGACAAGAGQAASIAQRHPPEGEFAGIDGVRLHYRVTGPEDGAPVLVLHGASSNHKEPFMALEAGLSQYRAIWLDRPGLGWSERPGGAWSPEREAALIARFLDHLGVDTAAVIGHSWGAAITLRLMMDHPERTRGAVLIAPAVRAWIGEAALYNRATGWPVIGTLITRAAVPLAGPGGLESGAVSAFHPEPVPPGYLERSALALILRPGPWKANARDMARVNEFLADQETRYGGITQPVIIVAGPRDSVVRTSRHAAPVAETLPQGELRLIGDAGHNLHHAHADEIGRALADVLERAARAG